MTQGSYDYYEYYKEKEYCKDFQQYLKNYGIEIEINKCIELAIDLDINDAKYDFYSTGYKFLPSFKLDTILNSINDRLINKYFNSKFLIFCYCINNRLSKKSILNELSIDIIQKIKYKFSYEKIFNSNKQYFNTRMNLIVTPFLICDFYLNLKILLNNYKQIIDNQKIYNKKLNLYLKNLIILVLEKKHNYIYIYDKDTDNKEIDNKDIDYKKIDNLFI